MIYQQDNQQCDIIISVGRRAININEGRKALWTRRQSIANPRGREASNKIELLKESLTLKENSMGKNKVKILSFIFQVWHLRPTAPSYIAASVPAICKTLLGRFLTTFLDSAHVLFLYRVNRTLQDPSEEQSVRNSTAISAIFLAFCANHARGKVTPLRETAWTQQWEQSRLQTK